MKTLSSDDVKHEFDVLHFELLREYIELEFIGCKKEMTFDFDMDKIADDWVVLCILIGNDYIPNMPNFDLRFDVLSLICDTYRELLTVSKGKSIERNDQIVI